MTYSKYFIILLFFVSCEEAILFQEATDFHTIVIVSDKKMTITTQSLIPHSLSGHSRKHLELDLFRIYLNDKELQAQRDYFINRTSEEKEDHTDYNINHFEIKKDLYVSLDNIHVKITYEDLSFEAWIKPLKKVEKASIEYYHDHCKWISPEWEMMSSVVVHKHGDIQIISSGAVGTVDPNFYIWEKSGKWKTFKSGQYARSTWTWVINKYGYKEYSRGPAVRDTSDYFYEKKLVDIASYDQYAVRYMVDGKLKGADNVIGNGVAFSFSLTKDTVRLLR